MYKLCQLSVYVTSVTPIAWIFRTIVIERKILLSPFIFKGIIVTFLIREIPMMYLAVF